MTLKPYFNDSNEFMEHILRPMKDCYHLFLGKRSHGFLEKLCTDCTRPEAVAHVCLICMCPFVYSPLTGV